MAYRAKTIVTIFYLLAIKYAFCQSKIDVIPWNEKVPKLHTDTIIRCDCPRNISYYLDSVKIDLKKVFFKVSSIESITFVDHRTALWTYNDDSKGGIGFISSKETAEFLPIQDFLSLKNIQVPDVNNVIIRINNKTINERDMLIDTDADIIISEPLNGKKAQLFRILDIYTDEKELNKKKVLISVNFYYFLF